MVCLTEIQSPPAVLRTGAGVAGAGAGSSVRGCSRSEWLMTGSSRLRHGAGSHGAAGAVSGHVLPGKADKIG